MLDPVSTTRRTFHPLGFAPNRREGSIRKTRKTPATLRPPRGRPQLAPERPTNKKIVRPMPRGHPEQILTGGPTRETLQRRAIAYPSILQTHNLKESKRWQLLLAEAVEGGPTRRPWFLPVDVGSYRKTPGTWEENAMFFSRADASLGSPKVRLRKLVGKVLVNLP